MRLVPLPAGATCPAGGTDVRVGLDLDGNGVLDDAEVSSSAPVCGGVTGTAGADGRTSLVVLVPEPAGANCTFGGHEVQSGVDMNGNGALDADEVQTTGYVCHGATGATGPQGPEGPEGPPGPQGPGISWSVIDAPVTASGNSGYLANSASTVEITLPTTLTVGDIVQVTGGGSGGWRIVPGTGQTVMTQGLPARYLNAGETVEQAGTSQSWYDLAGSADGSKLIAIARDGAIATSTDGGATWMPRALAGTWWRVASSSDGNTLLVGSDEGGLFRSTDGGVNWTPVDAGQIHAVSSVASSADGRVLLTGRWNLANGTLRLSTDGGASWNPVAYELDWYDAAVSADGSVMAAVTDFGQIHVSIDGGTTWTAYGPSRMWSRIAMSADGSVMLASAYGDHLYVSTDKGATWTPRGTVQSWFGVAVSSDGQHMAAASSLDGLVYRSSDGGMTWTAHLTEKRWRGLSLSSDGSRLALQAQDDFLFRSIDERTSLEGGWLGGSQYDSVALQYLGGGVFMPIYFVGTSGSFVVR